MHNQGFFSQGMVLVGAKLPTKRAADGGESARFIIIFLALSFFHISSLLLTRPRPPLTQTVSVPLRAKPFGLFQN